jgi:hypothetical protein
MTKRNDVNKLLKKFGHKNLRYEDGTILRMSGKMIRAIPAAKHSPMDKNENSANHKLNEVIESLIIELNAKIIERKPNSVHMITKKLNLILQIQQFPLYHRSGTEINNQYRQSVIEVFYY